MKRKTLFKNTCILGWFLLSSYEKSFLFNQSLLLHKELLMTRIFFYKGHKQCHG